MAPEKRSFGKAVRWSFVMNMGQQVGAAVVTLTLAAILGEEAFGTVALANVFVLFSHMLLEQGFTSALIQRSDLRTTHLNSVFWTMLAWGAILTGGGLLLADWWGSLYDDPLLTEVVMILALTIPIRALTVVHQAILQREMDFQALAVRSCIAVAAGGAIGLPMAIMGSGVWAIVAQQLTQALVSMVLVWKLSSWRPARQFEWKALKELANFSFNTFLSSLALFAHARADVFIIGLYFGTASVGIYQMAYRLMNLAVDVGSRAINAVALPELSKFQDDQVKLRDAAGRCLHVSAAFTIPLLGLLAALADVTLPLLGKNWHQATQPVVFLCLSGAINSVILFVVPLLNAVGRPLINAALCLVWGVLTSVVSWAVAFSVQDWQPIPQIVGIASSRSIISLLIHFPIYAYLARQVCGFRLGDFIRLAGPSFLAAIITVAAAAGLRWIDFLRGAHPLITFLVTAILVTLVCAASLWFLDPKTRELIAKVKNKLRKAAPST